MKRLAGAALLAAGILGLASLGAPASGPTHPALPPRLVLVSWDGAADWVIDRLLAEGKLPNLARLAARGVAADYSLTTFPSKTAVAHAALWTGCWPPCTGITANRVPLLPAAEHTLLEAQGGFSSEALRAEPIFVTAAKAGRTVVVLSATQSYPPEPIVRTLSDAGVPPERYRSFSGFELPVAEGRMIEAGALAPPVRRWRRVPGVGDVRQGAATAREAVIAVGDTTFYALAYDDPRDPVRGLDRVLVRRGDRDPRRATAEAVLEPRPAADGSRDERPGWSPPFSVRAGDREANTYFRLFDLAPDGSRLTLYQRAANALGGAHSEADLAAYLGAYPAFHDAPFLAYDDGVFGPTLAAGGDGTAERRALELVAFDTDLLIAGTRFALERWAPDVLLHYSPMVDSAGHSWMGALDPGVEDYDPGLAARLWPFYARVYGELDRWLGAIVEAAGAAGADDRGAVVALVSDHGMAGTRRDFFADRALEEAGLLARTAAGGKREIDLTRTRVLQPAFGDFYLKVNDVSWKGGIVPLAERRAAIDAAAGALLAARDPETGVHPVERVFRPDELPGLGIGSGGGDGGEAVAGAGDLYFDTAPGYYPRGGLADQVARPVDRSWRKGDHGFWPQRRSMHAIFYAAGPGLRTAVVLPPIRHIDVAPTLAHLIGIPAPAQAEGRVLVEALAGQEP